MNFLGDKKSILNITFELFVHLMDRDCIILKGLDTVSMIYKLDKLN